MRAVVTSMMVLVKCADRINNMKNKDTYNLSDVLTRDSMYKVIIFMVLCIKIMYMGVRLAHLIHMKPRIQTYNERMCDIRHM